MSARLDAMAVVDHAVTQFASDVRSRYGSDVAGIYLFGSRARGDHRPDSDADVAVVFKSDGFSRGLRLLDLADIAFDALVKDGVAVQPHPLTEKDWLEKKDDAFLKNVRHDAKPVLG